jgi:hypothetical protein
MWRLIFILVFGVAVHGQNRAVVNVGASPNDGTGDSARAAFIKVNTNFFQLWQTVYTNNVGVVVPVDTLAQVIAKAPSSSIMVATRGYHTAGDGGHGLYRWTNALPSGVSTNRGTWFAGANGFWSLVHDGTVNVRQFGARGDGVTDDFGVIQEASSVCATNAIRHIHFPSGNYMFQQSNVSWFAVGPTLHTGDPGTIITLGVPTSMGSVVTIDGRASGSEFHNISLDGGDFVGQNGWGIGLGVSNVVIRGGVVKRCRHDPTTNKLGGRGVTAQVGVFNILVDGVTVIDSYAAFDITGRWALNDTVFPFPLVGEDQAAEGVRIVNCYARNCEIMIQSYGRNNDTWPQKPRYLTGVFANIQGRNIGNPVTYPTTRTLFVESYTTNTVTTSANHNLTQGDELVFFESFGNVQTNTPYYVRTVAGVRSFTLTQTNAASALEFDIGGAGSSTAQIDIKWYTTAPITLDRAGNLLISNVQIYNDDNYPKIGSVIKGKGSKLFIKNLTFYGKVQNIIDARTFQETPRHFPWPWPWTGNAFGIEDSEFDISVHGPVGSVAVAEDGGSQKFRRNQIRATVDGLSWGIVDWVVAQKQDSFFEANRRTDTKQRGGNGFQIWNRWNNFDTEQGVASWNGNISLGHFGVAQTGGNELAIGGLYTNVSVFIRQNGLNQIELGSGRIRIPNSNWNGNRLFTYGDTRFFVDAETVKYKVGSDPSASGDGRVIGAKLQISSRTDDATYTAGFTAPVLIYAPTGNRTVTLSTTGALSGDWMSVVKPGTELLTIDVGPGIKTIPSGTAATVDCIYNGTAWVLWRYSPH